MTAPVLTIDALAKLQRLRERAMRHPVDVAKHVTSQDDAAYMAEYDNFIAMQTAILRIYRKIYVSLTLEFHPRGVLRHLVVSVPGDGALPDPADVWRIASAVGFSDSLQSCRLRLQSFDDGGTGIDVWQDVNVRNAVTA